MEFLNNFLPIIIYILLIILIILLIVLSIKAIKALDKVQGVIDNVDKKVKTFDPIFDLFESVTLKLTAFGDSLVSKIGSVFTKLFKKNDKKEIEEEEEE